MVHDPEAGFRKTKRLDGPIPLAMGDNTLELPQLGPATGDRFVSVWVKHQDKVLGWRTGHFSIGENLPRIKSQRVASPSTKSQALVTGSITLSEIGNEARMEVEVFDMRGRLLAEEVIHPTSTDVSFSLDVSQALGLLLELRMRFYCGNRLQDQSLVRIPNTRYLPHPEGTADDFHFLVWSSGQNDAIRHHINRLLADGGVNWIDNTGLNTGDMWKARVYCENAARYNLASVPYITRIASMQDTGRERKPCLHDPDHIAAWTDEIRLRALGAITFKPPAYTLGDENFLVRNKLDVCISPHSLAAFRESLQKQYGSLDRLNESWQTGYGDWAEIVPPTFAEVKDEPAVWPRWADHRLFMDHTLTEAHTAGREAIRLVDPHARVGFDGVFSLDSWHGYNFYRLCEACDLLQVYASRHEQIEYLRSWQQPNSVVGAWYNRIGNRDETSAKRMAWHLLFHDFNGAWYWTSYNTGPALLFPDLRTTPQFLWMQESIREIQSGIGKLLLNARRQHDRIAVYYSQASVHAGTLMNRDHAAAIWGFARLMEDLQLQYELISYDVRRQTPVGEVQRISTTLTPGEPQIYALLPYKVAGVTVQAVADQVHPGDVAEFDVRLDLGGRQPAGKHGLRIEVMTPQGEPVDCYAQNLLTDVLSTRVSVPLALNDLSGTWTLRATDVASGLSTTVPFTVAKR